VGQDTVSRYIAVWTEYGGRHTTMSFAEAYDEIREGNATPAAREDSAVDRAPRLG
jgi:hypothetical protein